MFTNIFKKHSSHFISCEQSESAFSVGNGDTYTVTVGVSSEEKVGLYLFTVFQSYLKSFTYLRIGVWAGSEVAVRILLFLYYSNVCDAKTFEYLTYGLISACSAT